LHFVKRNQRNQPEKRDQQDQQDQRDQRDQPDRPDISVEKKNGNNGRMEGWKDGSLTCILTRIKLKCKYEKIDQ